jgi:DNA-binding transcriptional MocR family regulator
MDVVRPSAIRDLLKHGADPDIISFGGGYPDPALFPVAQLREVFEAILGGDDRSLLQYAVTDGLPSLRRAIAARMAADGVACGVDEVIVLQGAQQGLSLVAQMLVDPGDVIVVEHPTFLGAMLAFNPCQPAYATVRTDEDGLDPDDLERVLAANPGATFLYTMPDFHNPMGVSMSLERRRRVIEIANRFDIIVLEDSPYRQLRFEGETLPTLKSLDTEGRVIFLGSFSKTLVPGLRLGWAVGDPELIGRIGLLKTAADTQTSTLNMAAAAAFLERFDLDAHIAEVNAAYRRKRDLMLGIMDELFPPSVGFTRPEGGLFTWLTFPEGFDATAFMRDRALPEAKVAYVPGATFFANEQQPNHARVNYSGVSDERIVAGTTRLGELLRSALPG